MPEQLSRLRVLIADDDFSTRLLASEGAASQGMDSLEAEDGASALALYLSHRPDLVLLDLRMPNGDGYETCRQLKSQSATQRIPIIFMSARTETEDVVAGFDIGAVDYISKPLRMAEVCARVRTQLQIRNKSETHEEQAERLVLTFEQALEATEPDGRPDFSTRLTALRLLLDEAYREPSAPAAESRVEDELAELRRRRNLG